MDQSSRPVPTKRQFENALDWFRIRADHDEGCPGKHRTLECDCGRLQALKILSHASQTLPNEVLGAVPDATLEMSRSLDEAPPSGSHYDLDDRNARYTRSPQSQRE